MSENAFQVTVSEEFSHLNKCDQMVENVKKRGTKIIRTPYGKTEGYNIVFFAQ